MGSYPCQGHLISCSDPPEHDGAALEALHTVWCAAMVEQRTQRVNANTNRSQLIITNSVVVGCKACYQESYLLCWRQKSVSILAMRQSTLHEMPG